MSSAFPHLLLELVSTAEGPVVSLTFDPHPDLWVFDERRGSREQLRQELRELADQMVKDTFDPQQLRARVLFVLLTWTATRGLSIPLARG